MASSSGNQDGLRLYCFDFDDNIVTTDSKVWTVDGPKTTAELATLKDVQLADNPFREFVPETIDTCKIVPGPFLKTLGRAIAEGSPVAVISARSLKEEDFRRLVSRAARELLGVELHDRFHFYCCNRSDWALPGKEAAPRKCAAVAHFLNQYPMAISIGFSDDDQKNLAAMRGLFAGLAVVRPDLRCRVYDAMEPSSSPCGSTPSVVASSSMLSSSRD